MTEETKSGHLVEEALRLGANKKMSDHNFKLSRRVNGWDVEMDYFGTPEDTATLLAALDGIFGPAPQASPAAAATPATTENGGTPPSCPRHNVLMRVSKYGGFYCTAQDPEGGYCDQKVR